MAGTDVLDSALFAALERAEGRCELVDAEIVEMTPTNVEHARIALRIGFLLTLHAQRTPGLVVIGSEAGFIWDGRNVRAPDAAVITKDDWSSAPARGFIPFAPLLAVEVVSPTDSWRDVHMKASGWLEHGAKAVWVVDPADKLVLVHLPERGFRELRGSDLLAGEPALPGFSCPVSDLFA